jgi:AraC family transcriptional regulator
MLTGFGELLLAQADGTLPTTLAAGSARGKSGVSVLRLRFPAGVDFSATAQQHLIWFVSRVRAECRMADRTHRHDMRAGALAICAARIDCAADANADEDVDALIVAIDPGRLALAAAEGSASDVQLNGVFSGYDQALLDLARNLAAETADDYPNGPLYWSEVASGFIEALLARYTSECKSRARGTLGKDVLERLRDYVIAHLDEPIEVASLAKIAGRSPFHFSRMFRRSVGVSPHRYVVHLRLQRAIALLRGGRSGLAEIAARTGFADQSHLSRWVRRVHGASLTQLAR